MDLGEKFKFGVGLLLLWEGIVGIILFSHYGDQGHTAYGIIAIIGGAIFLFLSVKPREERPSFRLFKTADQVFFAILFLSAGLLVFFLTLFGETGGSVVSNYYISGVLLSWGVLPFTWILVKRIRNIEEKKLEPRLEIIEFGEIQEQEIAHELKIAGISPTGEVQMIIKRVGYSDPVYARKIIRAWPWRAKGRLILTDAELIFLSVKKKKINFSIPISEIGTIHPFPARSGALSYTWCEVLYGNPKISAIFTTRFFGADIYNLKLLETLQTWYDRWTNEVGDQ